MTLAITRTELDLKGLRASAARSQDAAAARRMLALALVLEGHNRTDAARAAGMDRQTLRDWVHHYNERGVEGLKNLPERGVRRRLSRARDWRGPRAAHRQHRSDEPASGRDQRPGRVRR
ncbi:MAG TPA: helix-turn-helix domain-containing protein, partial [Acetobacteraceae bacterium]